MRLKFFHLTICLEKIASSLSPLSFSPIKLQLYLSTILFHPFQIFTLVRRKRIHLSSKRRDPPFDQQARINSWNGSLTISPKGRELIFPVARAEMNCPPTCMQVHKLISHVTLSWHHLKEDAETKRFYTHSHTLCVTN